MGLTQARIHYFSSKGVNKVHESSVGLHSTVNCKSRVDHASLCLLRQTRVNLAVYTYIYMYM